MTYQSLAKKHQPKPRLARNMFLAFLTGGAISLVGQILFNLYRGLGLNEGLSGSLMAVTLVFLAGLLTALGWYDAIGRIGGAGSAIPITGFANSVVSPAVEFRQEGMVLGMAARMFTVAGPVIVYGVVSAVVVGILRWLVVGAG